VLIWRGWGILTVVTLLGGAALVQLAGEAIVGEATYEANRYAFSGLSWMLGGIATYLVGQWLDRRNRPPDLVDSATRQRVSTRARNDLFWIPMPTWGLVGIVGGTTMILLGTFGSLF
jgi:hypothetical protein